MRVLQSHHLYVAYTSPTRFGIERPLIILGEAICATGDEAILLAVVGKCETHVEGDLLRHGTLIITP